MSRLLNFYRLKYHSTTNGTNLSDIKDVNKRFNQFVLIAFVCSTCNIFISYFFQNNSSIYLLSGLSVILGFVLILNKRKYFVYAKVATILAMEIFLVLLGFFEGLTTGTYVYFFPLLFAIPLIIDNGINYRLELIIYYTLTAIAFTISMLYTPQRSAWQFIPDETSKSIFFINSTSSVVVTAVFAYLSIYIEKQYAAAILIEKQKADEITQSHSNFLLNMGHALHTPLNGILGAANFLEKQKPTITQLEYLNIIKFCSHHVLGLTNDILDHKKIEAGEFELNKIKFNLKQVFQQCAVTFLNEFSEKRLELKLELGEELDVMVEGDDLRLVQVLNNLISNALKFTEEGYVKFSASIQQKGPDGIQVKCKVEDSGVGISEANQQKIFYSFWKTQYDNLQTNTGAGLGLSIAQKLLHLMNSELLVKSTENQGSTFYFTFHLPLARVKETVKQSQSDTKPVNLSGIKVLVAEDNKLTMLLTTRVLQDAQATVVATLNGKTTLLKLHEDSDFNIILLDLNMPEVDGYTVMQEIKQHYNHIPTLAFTANLLNNDMYQNLLKLGFADCVLKPFEPEELLTTVKRFATKSYTIPQ